jgi:hypothetical protein
MGPEFRTSRIARSDGLIFSVITLSLSSFNRLWPGHTKQALTLRTHLSGDAVSCVTGLQLQRAVGHDMVT